MGVMFPSVLALDLGTSSVRAALYDHRGHRLSGTIAQQSHQLVTDHTGKAELDPWQVLHGVQACLDQAVTTKRTIAAVGVSSFWHSLLGVDAAGVPVTPIYTWADSRCGEDAVRLRRRWSERQIHARTGCMVRPSFWPAKLAWLKRTEPGLWRRVQCWVSSADWLHWRLTGVWQSAHGMATGTGLYDPNARAWDARLVRACGLRRDQLAGISDAPAGLLPVFHRRYPALVDAAWLPAIGDGAANNLGVGATRPGWAAINVGTSAAVRIVRDRGCARAPFGLFCYRIDARRFLIGGAISNAGNLRAWCREQVRIPDDPALESELARRPDPHPTLRVIPAWLAERAPSWREDLRGAVVGITQATTAIDLAQAITEASYQRLASIVTLIPGHRRLRLIVGGGIQRSPSSLQRLADCIGQPLIASDEAEASLRGAAVLALEHLGICTVPITGRSIRPDVKRVLAYRRHRRTLRSLESACFGRG